MELMPLIYFKLVAKLENMSRAAEQLHITQPALSKSISQLEASLGVPLFDRNGRSIRLNRYGKFFLERTELILREYDRAREDLTNLIAPGQGEVSIGFMHTLGLQVIPALLTDVRNVYPQMKFQLTQSNSGVLLHKLEAGDLDLCLISSVELGHHVHWEKLWDEELFLIVPYEHPLVGEQSVKLEQFAAEPFISIKKGNSLRKSVDELYRQEGFVLNVAFEGEEIHTVAGLVESGLGVSLIPHIKGLEQYRLHVIPVAAENCKREIGIAYMENRFISAVTEQFSTYVKQYFKEN
ncbi:LysR family transcriptional regulator [Solibacillus sp. FSL H8-0538]|uniref:LysR family transcriptional regulator n=1 Tax=Solibacillus sp. FSL H8-0538 TaxID=2921400 RepID=UPI0030FCD87F